MSETQSGRASLASLFAWKFSLAKVAKPVKQPRDATESKRSCSLPEETAGKNASEDGSRRLGRRSPVSNLKVGSGFARIAATQVLDSVGPARLDHGHDGVRQLRRPSDSSVAKFVSPMVWKPGPGGIGVRPEFPHQLPGASCRRRPTSGAT